MGIKPGIRYTYPEQDPNDPHYDPNFVPPPPPPPPPPPAKSGPAGTTPAPSPGTIRTDVDGDGSDGLTDSNTGTA